MHIDLLFAFRLCICIQIKRSSQKNIKRPIAPLYLGALKMSDPHLQEQEGPVQWKGRGFKVRRPEVLPSWSSLILMEREQIILFLPLFQEAYHDPQTVLLIPPCHSLEKFHTPNMTVFHRVRNQDMCLSGSCLQSLTKGLQ